MINQFNLLDELNDKFTIIVSEAKKALEIYKQLEPMQTEDADFHVSNLKKAAENILETIRAINTDRIEIEAALIPDEDDRVVEPDKLFDTCVSVVNKHLLLLRHQRQQIRLRESGFNGVGEDDSHKERFLNVKEAV